MRITFRILTAGLALAALVAGAAAQEVARESPPRVIKEVKPEYMDEAKKAGIQGSVLLGVTVEADGSVGEVTVTRSLDKEHGLDEQAVKAVKQWKFEPGRKDGKPVAVLVQIEMTFTLK